MSASVIDPWLSRLHQVALVASASVSIRVERQEITVFVVPERLREEDLFRVKTVELGLQNRTLVGQNEVQELKYIVASKLVDKLSELQRPAGATRHDIWDGFAGAVVKDVSRARAKFQSCTSGMSDEVVKTHLALDALFLIFFFQNLNSHSFIFPEFESICEHHKATLDRVESSDFWLLENQIPMNLLKHVVTELCKIESDGTQSLQRRVEDELNQVLATAIWYLYPQIGYDIGRYGAETTSLERFLAYLESQYPRHTRSALENCDHILDCMYHFICGHRLPYSEPSPDRKSQADKFMNPLPSATSLEDRGIKVDPSPWPWTVGSIRLDNSILQCARLRLPIFWIHNDTELQLRNLAIYEELMSFGQTHFRDIRCFLGMMGQLCRNQADWDLLSRRGVFNVMNVHDFEYTWDRCGRGIFLPPQSGPWIVCYEGVDAHCRSWWKTWRRRHVGLYFREPIIILNGVAAFLGLMMSGMQTWSTVTDHINNSQADSPSNQ